jgi:hypothetical protein
VVRSPNGEDALYVFHHVASGLYVLLPYNLIKKEVASPITCHGYSLFDDGTMVIFRAQEEASRIHPLQIWRTPFFTAEHAASAPTDGSYLAKVGNAELVRGISDALSLRKLCFVDAPRRSTFEDVVRAASRMVDAYYWLSSEEAFDLASAVRELAKTAESILDEFDKVEAMRARAGAALAEAEATQKGLLAGHRPDDLKSVDAFMAALTGMRRQRGKLVTLRELQYMDLARVGALDAEVVAAFDATGRACVAFLLEPSALAPLFARLDEATKKIDAAPKSAELTPLGKEIDDVAEGLGLLGDIAQGLKVDDPTIRTRILEHVSEVMSQLNRARAVLAARKKDLAAAEGRAEFAVQFKLYGQSVANALATCDSPEKCDQELSKALVSLEELEGKFGAFEGFVADLADKREEVSELFGSKRQQLRDELQKRVGSLVSAAERILAGVARKARTFASADELNAYFAADAMVAKLREVAEQLMALGDSVKADEVEGKLKAARQNALRALRDKEDLGGGADDVVRFGRHTFNVNTQPLELALVPREGGLSVHLTGTDFYETIDDPTLVGSRDLWEQQLPSESAEVYRGEYLAYAAYRAAERGDGGSSMKALHDAALVQGGLLGVVRALAEARVDEGYDRGVHDHDAALLLERLVALHATVGLFRYGSRARALACLTAASLPEAELRTLARRARSLGRLREKLGGAGALEKLARELDPTLRATAEAHRLSLAPAEVTAAALYLVEELAGADKPRFSTSADAVALRDALASELEGKAAKSAFDEDLRQLEKSPAERLEVALAWLEAFAVRQKRPAWEAVTLEAAVLLVTDRRLEREASSAVTTAKVEGLLGQHARIEGRALELRFDELLSRLRVFDEELVPRFRAYRRQRAEVAERERARLRLDELRPRVLTSFVRNRLIDEVYLPLVGNNLAKQLGAAGAGKRTDLMGLLLLVSPPGYGKTTLMEYVASKLGLVFMKINGPSIGHDVRSLDPREAPNATAKQEVEKINLALEMGNNVMLYLDDIQHTSPELLQKFISLCDAQRRIEGVWNGRTRTYDLRGKKFCVCMAGNPYTETGEKFRIPDMLANRADTYNLGDILDGKVELFELSYLENALTSSAVLAPLSGREPKDLHKLVRMAQGEDVALTELSHAYSAAEAGEITSVLEKLLRVQKVLLAVNLEYIKSAAQEDAYRTEPPFKLQGSYRNMNKITEKVVAAHTDQELERLIDDHYAGESQTLTTGAEQNLLKLAELRGRLTAEQKARWDEIKKGYARQKRMGGRDDDPAVRIAGSITGLGEQLEGLRDAVVLGVPDTSVGKEIDALFGPRLERLEASLARVVGELREARSRESLRVSMPDAEKALSILVEQMQALEGALHPIARGVSGDPADKRALEGTLARLADALGALERRLAEPVPVTGVVAELSPGPHYAGGGARAAAPGAHAGVGAQATVGAQTVGAPTVGAPTVGAQTSGAHAAAGAARAMVAGAAMAAATAGAQAEAHAAQAHGPQGWRPEYAPPAGALPPSSTIHGRPTPPPPRPTPPPPRPTPPPPAPRAADEARAPMVLFEVELGAETPSNFYVAARRSLDVVEQGGVFVATFKKLPTDGTALRLELRFPGGARFECYAVVTFKREAELDRPHEPPGFGARLVGLSGEQKALVQRFVMHRDPFVIAKA